MQVLEHLTKDHHQYIAPEVKMDVIAGHLMQRFQPLCVTHLKVLMDLMRDKQNSTVQSISALHLQSIRY